MELVSGEDEEWYSLLHIEAIPIPSFLLLLKGYLVEQQLLPISEISSSMSST